MKNNKVQRAVLAAHTEKYMVQAKMFKQQLDQLRLGNLNAIAACREVAAQDLSHVLGATEAATDQKLQNELARRSAGDVIKYAYTKRQTRRHFKQLQLDLQIAHSAKLQKHKLMHERDIIAAAMEMLVSKLELQAEAIDCGYAQRRSI
eukprot:SAG31_NODE_1042_length_10187_cov_54.452121_14_plen_148_part_00